MEKHASPLFLITFCMVLLSVSVIQTIHELQEGGGIQVLDLLTDTFVTPRVRSMELEKCIADADTLFRKIRNDGRSGVTGDDDQYERSEELLVCVEKAKRLFFTINRHVVDSVSEETIEFNELVNKAKSLHEAIETGGTETKEKMIGQFAAILERINRKFARKKNSIRRVSTRYRALFKTPFFNADYIRSFERELEKRSLAARTLRPVLQFTRYALFRDYGEKVIPGKRGWLFYRPDVEYLYRPSVFDRRSKITDYNDHPLVDDPLSVIDDFKEQLLKRGIGLLVVVIPGKPSLYPDKIVGEAVATQGLPISHSIAFLDSLRKRNIDCVDLFTPFLEERKNDESSGEALYLATDTHWKGRGVKLASRIVAKKITNYSWYGEAYNKVLFTLDSCVVERVGDVGSMSGLPDNPFKKLRIRFPVETTQCRRVSKVYSDEHGAVLRREPYRDDFRNSRILILGDSFSRIYQTDQPKSSGWIAHLAYELSEPVASFINDGGASTLVREKLARNPEVLNGKRLVVWEFVERDIRFGALGWKRIKIP